MTAPPPHHPACGSHREVGAVEVTRGLSCLDPMPEVAGSRFGDTGFTLPRPVRLHPIHRGGELRRRERLRRSSLDRQRASRPAPSALHLRPQPHRPSHWRVRSLLTSRSGSSRRPFRHKARSPQVRRHSFAARPPDRRRMTFDHESFAASCPLALIGTAFYPVLVRRHTGSLRASSPHSVTLLQSRFASFVVINLRPDLHRQECAHAGAHEKPGRSRVCRRPQGSVRPLSARVRRWCSAAPPAPASAP